MSEAASTPSPAGRKGTLIQPRETDYKEIALRIGLVLLNIGSVALLWWSLQGTLQPLQRELRDVNTTVTRLITDVESLERAWSQPVVEQTRGKFGEVRSYMFVGRPAVESWINDVKQSAVPLALDVGFDFNLAEPSSVAPAPTNAPASITPTPVALSVRPGLGIDAANPSYQRLLQLSQRLTVQEKRADLVELRAAAGSNSVDQAVLVLHLWTAEESDLQ